MKESKEVQNEAYEIASYILNTIENKDTITRDEFEDLVAKAVKDLYNQDFWNDCYKENGQIVINEKEFYFGDFVDCDIRGILSYNGWATNFENGDLTTKELEV